MLKATVNGLQRLRRPEEVAQTRGLTVAQVLPVARRREEAVVAEPAPEPELVAAESAEGGPAAESPEDVQQ
jgi:hypothetical protein